MSKQVQDAFIVAARRTPIGKAPKGAFRNVRPDDMLAHVLKGAIAQVPGLDPRDIDHIRMASQRVAPRASAPSLRERGTVFSTSLVTEATVGRIITARMSPAAR